MIPQKGADSAAAPSVFAMRISNTCRTVLPPANLPCLRHTGNSRTSNLCHLAVNNMTTRQAGFIFMFAVGTLCLGGCDAILHVTGHVIDLKGAPVASAKVTVTTGADSDVQLPPYSCKSDATGRFVIPVMHSPHPGNQSFQVNVTKQGCIDDVRTIPESGFVGTIILSPSTPDTVSE